MDILSNKILDAKGLNCPMPIIKTKKAMESMEIGEIIEVHATDKGSLLDFPAWAKSTNNEYLGYETEGNVYKHFIKKTSSSTKSK